VIIISVPRVAGKSSAQIQKNIFRKITEEIAAIKKPLLFGLLGILGLLGFYFVVLTFVSGWSFTKEQFDDNWYYVLGLSAGFGIQIGLYSYLRSASQRGEQLHHKDSSEKVVVASGATSTTTMIACCSHYLVNILPIIGVTGLVVFVAQYQTQLFWFGILANLLGIGYIFRRVIRLQENRG